MMKALSTGSSDCVSAMMILRTAGILPNSLPRAELAGQRWGTSDLAKQPAPVSCGATVQIL